MPGVKRHPTLVTAAVVALAMGAGLVTAMDGAPGQVLDAIPAATNKTITAADCTAGAARRSRRRRSASRSRRDAVGARVGRRNGRRPAHCRVDGVMAPVDTRRHGDADQLPRGAAGVVERARGADRRRRHERHHSESRRRRPGRQGRRCWRAASPPTAATRAIRRRSAPRRRGAAAPGAEHRDDWALNDEAIANLGYMQMKKTHDAAMVLIERALRRAAAIQLLHRHVAGRPRGAHRRAALSRRLRRHRRQRADRELLDADAGARADPHPREAAGQLGDARQGQRDPRRVHAPVRRARRAGRRHHQQLHGVPRDLRRQRRARATGTRGRRSAARTTSIPNPADTSADACLTDGQISTLEFVYSRYAFATPLANGVRDVRHVGAEHRSVGQRPDPRTPGSRGRRAPPADAPMHAHLGVLGVTGFLMQDLSANPLDYVEGGALNARRRRAVGDARRDQSRPRAFAQARRQDDRHHRHQRHAGVAGRAARLLPVGDRQDGAARRSIASRASSSCRRPATA